MQKRGITRSSLLAWSVALRAVARVSASSRDGPEGDGVRGRSPTFRSPSASRRSWKR